MSSNKINIIFFDDQYSMRKKVLTKILDEEIYNFVRVDYITNESLKIGEVGAAITPREIFNQYCNHGNHCFLIVDLALIHQSRNIEGGVKLLKNFRDALKSEWEIKKFNEKIAIISNHKDEEVEQTRLSIEKVLGIDFEKAFFFWGELRRKNEEQERLAELVKEGSCK